MISFEKTSFLSSRGSSSYKRQSNEKIDLDTCFPFSFGGPKELWIYVYVSICMLS